MLSTTTCRSTFVYSYDVWRGSKPWQFTIPVLVLYIMTIDHPRSQLSERVSLGYVSFHKDRQRPPRARRGFPGEQVRASSKPITRSVLTARNMNACQRHQPQKHVPESHGLVSAASSYCVHSLRPVPQESEGGCWAVFSLDIVLDHGSTESLDLRSTSDVLLQE